MFPIKSKNLFYCWVLKEYQGYNSLNIGVKEWAFLHLELNQSLNNNFITKPNHTSFRFLLTYGVKYIRYSLSIYESDHLWKEKSLFMLPPSICRESQQK